MTAELLFDRYRNKVLYYKNFIVQEAPLKLLREAYEGMTGEKEELDEALKSIIVIEVKRRIPDMPIRQIGELLYFLRNNYPNSVIITYAVGILNHKVAEATMRNIKVPLFSSRYGYSEQKAPEKVEEEKETMIDALSKFVNNYPTIDKVFDKYQELKKDIENPFTLVKWEMISSRPAKRDFDTCHTSVGKVACYKILDGYEMIKMMKIDGVTNPFEAVFKHPSGATVKRIVV